MSASALRIGRSGLARTHDALDEIGQRELESVEAGHADSCGGERGQHLRRFVRASGNVTLDRRPSVDVDNSPNDAVDRTARLELAPDSMLRVSCADAIALVAVLPLERAGRTNGQQAALVEDRDAVAQLERLFGTVCRQHHRAA